MCSYLVVRNGGADGLDLGRGGGCHRSIIAGFACITNSRRLTAQETLAMLDCGASSLDFTLQLVDFIFVVVICTASQNMQLSCSLSSEFQLQLDLFAVNITQTVMQQGLLNSRFDVHPMLARVVTSITADLTHGCLLRHEIFQLLCLSLTCFQLPFPHPLFVGQLMFQLGFLTSQYSLTLAALRFTDL